MKIFEMLKRWRLTGPFKKILDEAADFSLRELESRISDYIDLGLTPEQFKSLASVTAEAKINDCNSSLPSFSYDSIRNAGFEDFIQSAAEINALSKQDREFSRLLEQQLVNLKTIGYEGFKKLAGLEAKTKEDKNYRSQLVKSMDETVSKLAKDSKLTKDQVAEIYESIQGLSKRSWSAAVELSGELVNINEQKSWPYFKEFAQRMTTFAERNEGTPYQGLTTELLKASRDYHNNPNFKNFLDLIDKKIEDEKTLSYNQKTNLLKTIVAQAPLAFGDLKYENFESITNLASRVFEGIFNYDVGYGSRELNFNLMEMLEKDELESRVEKDPKMRESLGIEEKSWKKYKNLDAEGKEFVAGEVLKTLPSRIFSQALDTVASLRTLGLDEKQIKHIYDQANKIESWGTGLALVRKSKDLIERLGYEGFNTFVNNIVNKKDGNHLAFGPRTATQLVMLASKIIDQIGYGGLEAMTDLKIGEFRTSDDDASMKLNWYSGINEELLKDGVKKNEIVELYKEATKIKSLTGVPLNTSLSGGFDHYLIVSSPTHFKEVGLAGIKRIVERSLELIRYEKNIDRIGGNIILAQGEYYKNFVEDFKRKND